MAMSFEGKTPSSTMAAILATEPRPLRELQPVTPSSIERIVKRCLAKDPDDRWQTARDLRAEIEWAAAGGATADATAASAARSSRTPLIWKGATTLFAVIAVALAAEYFSRRAEPRVVTRFAVLPPEKTSFAVGGFVTPTQESPIAVVLNWQSALGARDKR